MSGNSPYLPSDPALAEMADRMRRVLRDPRWGWYATELRRTQAHHRREDRQRHRRERLEDRGVPERFRAELVPLRRTSSWLAVRDFLRGPGWLFVASGAVGVGKSFAAAWHVAFCRGSAQFVPTPALIAAGEYNEAMQDRVGLPYLLVLDDLGTEHADKTGWALGYLRRVLDARHREKRKTILTTNANLADFLRAYGDARLIDRMNQGAHFFEATETDSMRGST